MQWEQIKERFIRTNVLKKKRIHKIKIVRLKAIYNNYKAESNSTKQLQIVQGNKQQSRTTLTILLD